MGVTTGGRGANEPERANGDSYAEVLNSGLRAGAPRRVPALLRRQDR